MPLPYENPKWKKAREEVRKIGYDFRKVPAMDSYIKILKESGRQKADYARFFACLSVNYHLWVRDRYLTDPEDPLLPGDIFRSGLSGLLSQRLGGPGLLQWEQEFSLALYELAALGRDEGEYFTDKSSPLSCLVTGDFEAAKKLLSAVEADDAPRVGSQYLELKYLKNLYLAVIEGDEAGFNAGIVTRIKTLRRNPYTHTVVIDFPSAALLRIASRQGLAFREELAEIPKSLLTRWFPRELLGPLPPMAVEAAARFGISLPLPE